MEKEKYTGKNTYIDTVGSLVLSFIQIFLKHLLKKKKERVWS